MQVIGIVGTAKNTGKTTALTSILEELKNRNYSFAVTSIGYDGEDLDNLTYLPKPRINLVKDAIIATASLTLETAKLKYTVIEKTGIYTPLGEILIAKVTDSGKIVIAGPNNIRDLKIIISKISSLNPGILFVDGAMNRMAPMFLADKIIFATGASRNISTDIISDEMSVINFLFLQDTKLDITGTNSCMLLKDGKTVETGVSSLLSDEDLIKLLDYEPEKYDGLVLHGVFSSSVVRELLEKVLSERQNYELVFLEPFRILLSMSIVSFDSLKNIFPENVKLSFIHKPKLSAVTVNSFYPKYENFHFLAGYVDKIELKNKVTQKVSVPVYDIFDDGSKQIIDLILS